MLVGAAVVLIGLIVVAGSLVKAHMAFELSVSVTPEDTDKGAYVAVGPQSHHEVGLNHGAPSAIHVGVGPVGVVVVDATVDVEGDTPVLAAVPLAAAEPVMVPIVMEIPDSRFSEAIFASTIDAMYSFTSSGMVSGGVSSMTVIVEKLSVDDEDDDEDDDEELEDESVVVEDADSESDTDFEGSSLLSSWSLSARSFILESMSSTGPRSIDGIGTVIRPCN